MGFIEALTLVFIVLKLIGAVHWSWWGVLAPELIAVTVYVIIGVVVLTTGRKILDKVRRW